MARKMNPLRLTTPIVIKKTTKTKIRKLAKNHPTRKGTESDEMVILRILIDYEKNHPSEIEIVPRSTYREKPALLTSTF